MRRIPHNQSQAVSFATEVVGGLRVLLFMPHWQLMELFDVALMTCQACAGQTPFSGRRPLLVGQDKR
jgi:hypothetical protein